MLRHYLTLHLVQFFLSLPVVVLQGRERQKFFSIFYMSINAGSLLSTLITPILRSRPDADAASGSPQECGWWIILSATSRHCSQSPLRFLPGDVQCFGGDCYALAFGVPAALMAVALGNWRFTFDANATRHKNTPVQASIRCNVHD